MYAPPSIVKPLNLSVNVNLSDTLSWQSVGANLKFDIQIGKSELEASSDSSKMTTNKFYSLSNLLQNKFYCSNILLVQVCNECLPKRSLIE